MAQRLLKEVEATSHRAPLLQLSDAALNAFDGLKCGDLVGVNIPDVGVVLQLVHASRSSFSYAPEALLGSTTKLRISCIFAREHIQDAVEVVVRVPERLMTLLDAASAACLLAGSLVLSSGSFLFVNWCGDRDVLEVTSTSPSTSSLPLRLGTETRVRFLPERRQPSVPSPAEFDAWSRRAQARVPGLETRANDVVSRIRHAWTTSSLEALLLDGIAGSGTSTLARAVAETSSLPFRVVQVPALFSRVVGRARASLLAILSSMAPFSVLVLEQIDGLTSSESGRRLLCTLGVFLDDTTCPLAILVPTSRSAELPAFIRRPGRLSSSILLTLPNETERESMLRALRAPKEIVARTAGFVPADLQHLADEVHALVDVNDASDDDVASCWRRALRCVRPSSLVSTRVPRRHVELTSLGGLEAQQTLLQRVLLAPLRGSASNDATSLARLGVRLPRGLLLYGPPGCGKTTLAVALAADADAAVIEARASDIISAVVGASERNLVQLFERARSAAPAIILLDQLEQLAPRRHDANSRTFDRVLSCLLTLLDGVTSDDDDVIVVGTTTAPHLLDEAILRPGRVELHIELPAPDADARLSILQQLAKRVRLNKECMEALPSLAERLEACSGADLEALLREAALNALRQDHDVESVQLQHLLAASDACVPSLRDWTHSRPFEEAGDATDLTS